MVVIECFAFIRNLETVFDQTLVEEIEAAIIICNEGINQKHGIGIRRNKSNAIWGSFVGGLETLDAIVLESVSRITPLSMVSSIANKTIS